MPAHVAAADLNGDGTVDLVTVNGRDSISVLLSGGNASLAQRRSTEILVA
jgi:hypothetical protein